MTLQDVQLSVKNNSEELQDYLRDLKHWENDIKKEDLNLKKNINSNVKELYTKSEKNISDIRLSNEFSCVSYSGNEETQHIPSVPDSHKEKAEKLKEEGNKLYSQGKYNDAVAKYTQGIGLDSFNKLLPANRAMALIKLGKYKAAEKDCTKALTLDSSYIKAYLRRATTRSKIGNIVGAIEDYAKALELEPWNKTTKKELEKLKQMNDHDADVPPLEDPSLMLNKVNLTKSEEFEAITEVDKITMECETNSNPLYDFHSQKSLVKVAVESVSSREELEELLGNADGIKPSEKTPEIKTKHSEELEKSVEMVNLEKLEVPNAPRTSHQFSQDWKKVSKSKELSRSYLKNIPVSFFNAIEIEVELLIEIFSIVCDEYFDYEETVLITESLTKTRGFSINMSFLDPKQKEEISRLLKKIEKSQVSMEIRKHIKC